MFLAIVPAYNEGKNIDSVVQGLSSIVDKVVVVDDASIDDTIKKAKKSGAVVLSHKINRGQGACLQTGHDYAIKNGADYVLHFDGDGQFFTEDVLPALEELKKNDADILFGSRFLGKESNIPWFKKKIIFPIARFVNKFFGVYLSDIHNGFRVLNKRALNKIKIQQDRMAHATEIPVQVKKLDLKYIEFPVKVVYHRYGGGLGHGLGVVKDLLLGRFLK